MQGETQKKKSGHLLFLCWLVYTAAYLGKYSYSANITLIEAEFQLLHAESGAVTTMFFFAYGAGQILHGLFCKYYHKRYVLFGVLIACSVCNILLFAGVPFSLWKFLWLLNGAASAALWPSLVAVLSDELDTEAYKRAVVVMSTTTPVGLLLAYAPSALFAKLGNYRYTFLWAALVMSAAAVAWLLCYRSTAKEGARSEPEPLQSVASDVSPRKGISTALLFYLIVFGVFAMLTNLVREGLNTWMPTILKESYMLSDALSILLSLLLPLLGIFGAALLTKMHRKIPDFFSLMGVAFAISAACMLPVVFLNTPSLWWAMLLLCGVVVLLLYGVNSVTTSMMPLYLRDKVHAGKLAGIMNGCAYVGSTLSAYGLGLVADAGGWNAVFWVLFGACLLPALVSLCKRLYRQYHL